jgi:3-(3-hydroxy-phenyl)propionate hydroxylase
MRYDVAVLGAGPTGLTLANLLGQAGLNVAVIERNDRTVQEPRAVSIDDESLRTLQAAGLVEQILESVAQNYGSHYFTSGGRCFLKVEPTTRQYGFPRRNAFTQPQLEADLRTGLARFRNVTPLFSSACEAVSQDENGVTLSLRSTAGEVSELRAAYLVGCDGARSLVRKIIGGTLSGATYKQRWLIVDLAATRERLRQTRVVCDPVRPLITLPGPGGIRRYEFMLSENEADELATSDAFVQALLAASGPDSGMPVVRQRVYTFHARIADKWRDRRIFIAGDAAHLTPPFAGQGMNSGLRDAHNLAWKLAAAVHGKLGPSLLSSYQTERSPHAQSLIDLAMKMGQVMMPSSKAQAFLVQSAFTLARLVPSLQSYFAEMKYKPKPFYKAGFLLPGAMAVGRMLPQPLVELADHRRVMLDELLGNDFAMLAYGPQAQHALATVLPDLGLPCAPPLALLPRYVTPDRTMADAAVRVVRDVEGVCAGLAAANETVFLLVRPDRYVAVLSPLADGIAGFAASCRALSATSWSAPVTPP